MALVALASLTLIFKKDEELICVQKFRWKWRCERALRNFAPLNKNHGGPLVG